MARSDWMDYFPEDLDPYCKHPGDEEKPVPSGRPLRDALLSQLRIATDDPKLLTLGERVIDSLDDSGYIRDYDALFDRAKSKAERELLASVLKLIQTFEPAGVGAKNLKECLLLQTHRRLGDDSLEAKIIAEHLEDLAKQNYVKIIQALNVPEKRIVQALRFIRTLSPRPGRAYPYSAVAQGTASFEPHVIIAERDGEMVHMINHDAFPFVWLPESYRYLPPDPRKAPEEYLIFVRKRRRALYSAIGRIAAQQRILEKLSDFFIELQLDFLKKGLNYLRPMDLSVVAEQIDCTRREIVDAVRETYIQTPAGTFDFSEIMLDSTGLFLRERIKSIIELEDKTDPLTDAQIAQAIRGGGIGVEAPTIRKYRKKLGIPSFRIRKKETPIGEDD